MQKSSESHIVNKVKISKVLEITQSARDYLVIKILFETGCSLKELVGIKASDFNIDSIRFGTRRSMVSNELSDAISFYIQGNRLNPRSILLVTRQGPSISTKRIAQILDSYDLDYRSLRYSHIAHAYKNGLQVSAIAEQTGISETRVFQIIQELRLKGNSDYTDIFAEAAV